MGFGLRASSAFAPRIRPSYRNLARTHMSKPGFAEIRLDPDPSARKQREHDGAAGLRSDRLHVTVEPAGQPARAPAVIFAEPAADARAAGGRALKRSAQCIQGFLVTDFRPKDSNYVAAEHACDEPPQCSLHFLGVLPDFRIGDHLPHFSHRSFLRLRLRRIGGQLSGLEHSEAQEQ
jgi:hypothetical protein